MFGKMIVFAFVIILAEISSSFGDPQKSSKDLPEIKEGEPCEPGKFYRMDCNRCQCVTDGKLLCTKMFCYDPDDFKPEPRPKLRSNKQATSSDLPEAPKGPCIPGIVYQNGCNTCICDDKKQIHCGVGKCDLSKHLLYPKDLHEPFTDDELNALESIESFSSECTPGKAYKLDCNLCLCNELKSLICEQYACLNLDAYTANKIDAFKHIGKHCTADQKYELMNTCVTCTCNNGKTECQWQKTCEDKNYIEELKKTIKLLKVDPERDTCVPGGFYTISCNRCHCMYDAALRCTQMYCLNFAKANELRHEHDYLERNGL